MVWLWSKATDLVGTGWVQTYGSIEGSAIATWRDALGGYTLDQLKRGVAALAKWEERFPPTLGQFAKWCLTTPPETWTPPPGSLLEHLDRHANSQTAKAEIKKMRGIMRGRYSQTKEEAMEVLGL